MAKSKAVTFDAAFEIIEKNAQKATKRVVGNTARIVKMDVFNFANRLVDMYYAQRKPNHYKRTGNLRAMIVPYDSAKSGTVSATNTSGSGIVYRDVGVRFDANKLNKLYNNSNSSFHQSGNVWQNYRRRTFSGGNGTVEAAFVYNNFWHGVHPATNGERGWDYKKEEKVKNYKVKYTPIKKEDIYPEIDKWLDDYILNRYPNIVFDQWAKCVSGIMSGKVILK